MHQCQLNNIDELTPSFNFKTLVSLKGHVFILVALLLIEKHIPNLILCH